MIPRKVSAEDFEVIQLCPHLNLTFFARQLFAIDSTSLWHESIASSRSLIKNKPTDLVGSYRSGWSISISSSNPAPFLERRAHWKTVRGAREGWTEKGQSGFKCEKSEHQVLESFNSARKRHTTRIFAEHGIASSNRDSALDF